MRTDSIECPECGYKHEDDLHEGFDQGNDTTWECSRCEAQFFVERDFSVHYYVGEVTKLGAYPGIMEDLKGNWNPEKENDQ